MIREAVRAARRSGDVDRLLGAIPYAGFLGLRAVRGAGELVIEMGYAPALVGNARLPALHGGTLGALLETTAAVVLLWQVETAALPKIITITVDFLRPAGALDTRARARIVRQGRRVISMQAEAWQEDPGQPVALAQVHFLVEPAG